MSSSLTCAVVFFLVTTWMCSGLTDDTKEPGFPAHLELSVADDPSEKCAHTMPEARMTDEGNISLCFSNFGSSQSGQGLYWRIMTLIVRDKNLSVVTQVRRKTPLFADGALINIVGKGSMSILSFTRDRFPDLSAHFNGFGNASGYLNGSVTFTGRLNASMFEGRVVYWEHNVTHILHCPHDNTLGPDFYTQDTCIACQVAGTDSLIGSLHSPTPLGWRTISSPACKERGVEATDPGMADRHGDLSPTSQSSADMSPSLDKGSQARGEQDEKDGQTAAGSTDVRMSPFSSPAPSTVPDGHASSPDTPVHESPGFPRISESRESYVDDRQTNSMNNMKAYRGQQAQSNCVFGCKGDSRKGRNVTDSDNGGARNKHNANAEKRPEVRRSRRRVASLIVRRISGNNSSNDNDQTMQRHHKLKRRQTWQNNAKHVSFASASFAHTELQSGDAGKNNARSKRSSGSSDLRWPRFFSATRKDSPDSEKEHRMTSKQALSNSQSGAHRNTDEKHRSRRIYSGPHGNIEDRHGSGRRTRRRFARQARMEKEAVSCTLHLVSDHLFFREMGDRNPAKTLNLMVSVVVEADALFRLTDFDGDGDKDNIGFVVNNVTIIRNKDEAPYSYSRANGNAYQYLKNFSTVDFSDVCLGVAFTAVDFERGVVGLAWYGSSMNGGAGKGGICGQRVYLATEGRSFSFNTAILTFINHGTAVSLPKAVLTLAHEFGHTFGASHDDSPGSACNRNYPQGQYLMHRYRPSQFSSNNNRFSPCSIRQMYPVLVRKGGCMARYRGPVCGNGVIEGGEECDCGKSSECGSKDPCCSPGDAPPSSPDPPCTLRRSRGYQCSPIKSSCCTSQCRPVSLSEQYVCREASDCVQQSVCNGHSAKCPAAVAIPDGTLCHGGVRICAAGQCRGSLCRRAGLEDCFCTEFTEELCKLCCRKNSQAQCLPARVLNVTEHDVFFMEGDACLNYTGVCTLERGRKGKVCRIDDGAAVDESYSKLLGMAGFDEDNAKGRPDWFSGNWFYLLLVPLVLVGLGTIAWQHSCDRRSFDWSGQSTGEARRVEQIIQAAESRSREFSRESQRTAQVCDTVCNHLQRRPRSVSAGGAVRPHQRSQNAARPQPADTDRAQPGPSRYTMPMARRRAYSTGAINYVFHTPPPASKRTKLSDPPPRRPLPSFTSSPTQQRADEVSPTSSHVESDLDHVTSTHGFFNVPTDPRRSGHAFRPNGGQLSRHSSRSSNLEAIAETAGGADGRFSRVGFDSQSFNNRVQRWLRGEDTGYSGTDSSARTFAALSGSSAMQGYSPSALSRSRLSPALSAPAQRAVAHNARPKRTNASPPFPTNVTSCRSFSSQSPPRQTSNSRSTQPRHALSTEIGNFAAGSSHRPLGGLRMSSASESDPGAPATAAPSLCWESLPSSSSENQVTSTSRRGHGHWSRSSGLHTFPRGQGPASLPTSDNLTSLSREARGSRSSGLQSFGPSQCLESDIDL